jgi:UDP-glucose/GDP-mannose dehydrogenase family, central domain
VSNMHTLVIGLGEVGGALATVLERRQSVLRLDLEPEPVAEPIGVMHLCFPYQSPEQFEGAALAYIERFKPALTIINSTVRPGTTRSIADASKANVAYSPVRGKHAHMTDDMLKYFKFVAAPTLDIARAAEEHFESGGFKTRRMNRIETLELAKIAETTYFGVLIAFAQELNRYCDRLDSDYYEASEFFEEIDFLPKNRYFPGYIGGHCVIPNIHLLLSVARSPMLDAVLQSNDHRALELNAKPQSPKPEGRIGRDSPDAKVFADR